MPPTTFQVLGPLAVVDGAGSPVAIPEAKARLLLALLVRRDHVVASDALADMLWDGAPPAGGAQTLQSHISQLRKLLGATRIQTAGGGYRFVTADAEVDAEVFERDAADARTLLAADPAASADCASRALARWRGAALAEVAALPWAQSDAARLEELRLEVEELLLEARLALGWEAAVAAEADAAVRDQPLRERRWAALMLALYRSGRQADALDAFHRLRARLDEDLGILPSPSLRALHQAILEQDPALDRPEPATRSPSTATSAPLPAAMRRRAADVFVGRDNEQIELAAARKRAAAGVRQIVLLSGDPGIGKSSLVARFSCDAADDGDLVLAGRCVQDVGVPYEPFAPIVEALAVAMPTEPRDAWADVYGQCVARAFPALRAELAAKPASPADAEVERHLLFRGVRDLVLRACAITTTVLVLEDLHWADASSVRLLRYVTEVEDARLLIAATYRDKEIAGDHPVADLLAHLRRDPAVVRLPLTGLEDAEAIALVERFSGQEIAPAEAPVIHGLRRETDGNPFFLREILRHLLESGAVEVSGGRWRLAREGPLAELPESVRDIVLARVDRLGAAAVDVLRVAAAFGREFDLAVLAAAADAEAEGLVDVLDAAEHAGLLFTVDVGRFRFAHALVQTSLLQTLSATRRAVVHRRIAEALEAERPTPERTRQLAHHWSAAIAPVEVSKAIHYAEAAAELALGELAPLEAVRWIGKALELCEPDDLAQRCRLLVALGDAQQQAGQPGHRDTLLEAAHLAEQLGERELLVRAALANNRGGPSSRLEVDADRLAALDAALEAVGRHDSSERARLLATKAAELVSHEIAEQRRGLAEEALAVARRVDDPQTTLLVQHLRFDALWAPDTLDARAAIAVEMAELASRLRDPLSRFRAALRRMAVAIEQADGAAVDSALAEVDATAQSTGFPYMRWAAAMSRSCLALSRGAMNEAEEAADASLQVGTDSGQPEALGVYAVCLAEIRRHQGRLPELLPVLEAAAATVPAAPLHLLVGVGCAEQGRPEDAHAKLELYAAEGFTGIPFDEVWFTCTAMAGELALLLGDRAAATTLRDLLRPYTGQLSFNRATSMGAVARYVARLSDLLGDDSERDHDLAAALHERLGARLWSAYGLLDRGQACARRGDDAAARKWAEQAAAAAVPLGALACVRAATALA